MPETLAGRDRPAAHLRLARQPVGVADVRRHPRPGAPAGRAHAGRTVLTRWVAPDPARGSWAPYLDAWPFARVPADDRLYDLVDEVRDIEAPVVTATTFGKWVPDLVAITGETPHLVVAGVSTDCCVVSTALPRPTRGRR